MSADFIECLCTSKNGILSDASCHINDSTSVAVQHIHHSNDTVVKYYNSYYAYGEICNNSSTWLMNGNAFKMITEIELLDCYQNNSNLTSCGYENNLIDNGSYYWYV